MYQVSFTNQFKKDYKLIAKRNYDITKLDKLLQLLIDGKKLPEKYKQHELKNNFKGYFDCHITPDWLLIYKRDNTQKLITLVRTGTHSDIFG
jgi:mRNA interferase YafQ